MRPAFQRAQFPRRTWSQNRSVLKPSTRWKEPERTSAIATELVPVLPGDTVETLRARVHEVEHRLLPKVVEELCAR